MRYLIFLFSFFFYTNILFGNPTLDKEVKVDSMKPLELRFDEWVWRGPQGLRFHHDAMIYSSNNLLYSKKSYDNSVNYNEFLSSRTPPLVLQTDKEVLLTQRIENPNLFVYRDSDRNSWSKEIDGASFNHGFSLSDNRIMLIGTVFENHTGFATKGGSDIWVTILDKDGESTFSKTFGGSDDDRFFKAEYTSDSTILILGTTKSLDGDLDGRDENKEIWMLEIDEEGNKINSIITGTKKKQQLLFVKKAPRQHHSENGYLVILNNAIIKIDSTGEEEWSVENFDANISNIHFLASGNYIVNGQTTYSYQDFLIAEISNDGEILKRVIKQSSTDKFIAPFGNHYALQDSFVQLRTTFGDLIWEKKLDHGLEGIATFFPTTDGGVIVSDLEYGSVQDKLIGIKLNSDGSTGWIDSLISGVSFYNLPNEGYMSFGYLKHINSSFSSQHVPIRIFDPPTYCPPSNILPDTIAICSNEMVNINASQWENNWVVKQKTNYQWSTNETTPNIEVKNEGAVAISITMNDDCLVNDSVTFLETTEASCFSTNTNQVTLCYGESYGRRHFYESETLIDTTYGYPQNKIEITEISVMDKISSIGRDTSVCTTDSLANGRAIGFFDKFDVFENQNGCDSFVTTRVQIIEAPRDTVLHLRICPRDSVFIQDTFYLPNTNDWHYDTIEIGPCFQNLRFWIYKLPTSTRVENITLMPGDTFNNVQIFRDTVIFGTYINDYDCEDRLVYAISVTTSSSNDIFEKELGIKIYPNPTREKVTVEFDLKKATNPNFLIMDQLGRIIKRVFDDQYFQKGKNQITIETKDLPTGLYFLRIETKEGFAEEKFLKQ